MCVGFLCRRCDRLRLPSQTYISVLTIVSFPVAIGVTFLFLAAGYPEAIFELIAFWALSYFAVSYVAYRVIPPKLVVRYFGSVITLGLNEADEVDVR